MLNLLLSKSDGIPLEIGVHPQDSQITLQFNEDFAFEGGGVMMHLSY